MNGIHLEPLGGGMEIFVSESYHFSTDTILLADFSKPSGAKKCVDLGTGCGTIPLLWLRQNNKLMIDAVEIQEDACALAQRSVEHNGLGDSLRIINADLRQLDGVLEKGCYDLVACNPPYKPDGSGILNPEEKKLLARHESSCTFEDICARAASLLQFGGRFCVCHRPERLTDVLGAMRGADLEPKRLRMVQQRCSKAPKLFLAEGRRGGKKGFLEVMPTLFIEDGSGGFSEEMLAIYGDYKSGRKQS